MEHNAPEESEILRDIRAILIQYLPDTGDEISTDTDIFSMGMDSVSTLLLITEIENKYSINFIANDIPYDQLGTISGITSFVKNAIAVQKAGRRES